jgi:CTP synthase (UTP-ammonia lyase)
MNELVRIGIIGDRFAKYERPQSVVVATVARAAEELGVKADIQWIATPSLESRDADTVLTTMDGLWCSPGSPYLSLEGALNGIRFAREHDWPFIGTCAGFQHLILEYARNVMGITDATSEEDDADASNLFINRLACPIANKTLAIKLQPGSRVRAAYGTTDIKEYYYCTFGMNPRVQSEIDRAGLRVTGTDDEGGARVIELPNHRFFIGTLFVPGASRFELNIDLNVVHPLVRSFVQTSFSFRAAKANVVSTV